MSQQEIVALVDERGVVVGRAPRSVVRRDNLLHAATAVLVRDPAGAIYVHRRSPEKDWCPSHHDAAAGGVLLDGEAPADAARRELAEELGISGLELRPLPRSHYEDATVRCVEHCFEVTFDGTPVHADGEVVWGAWWTLEQLGERLADAAWPFVPDTRSLLASLRAAGVGDYARLGGPS